MKPLVDNDIFLLDPVCDIFCCVDRANKKVIIHDGNNNNVVIPYATFDNMEGGEEVEVRHEKYNK